MFFTLIDWGEANDPNFGKPTNEALTARETISLYKWWKVAQLSSLNELAYRAFPIPIKKLYPFILDFRYK